MKLFWFLKVPAFRKILGLLLIVALGAFLLLPLLSMILWAFANRWQYPGIIPQSFSIKWWIWVFKNGDVGKAMFYSFTTAPVVTLLSALICVPAAYAFSRLNFPGKRFFFVSLLATNAFPKFGLYISIATLFYALDLMNTFMGVVFVQIINTVVYMTWIPTAGFDGVARELEEAARDAGASKFRVFWRVTLPIAMPSIAVGAILSFIAAFDEAQGTLVIGAPKITTMPVLMYRLVANYPEPVSAVFSILLTIPSIILLLFARRYLLAGYLAAGFMR